MMCIAHKYPGGEGRIYVVNKSPRGVNFPGT